MDEFKRIDLVGVPPVEFKEGLSKVGEENFGIDDALANLVYSSIRFSISELVIFAKGLESKKSDVLPSA